MNALAPEPRSGAGKRLKRRPARPDLGRAKVALPNGLTLGNLFFGINAIIAASRGAFDTAVLFIVLGGVCDAFDGAAARATRTGGRFGEELDSLVDAISFGLAPAMIVHFAVLANGGSGWNWAVFIFAACAVMRLARFNVTQAGESKTYFQGLPSPAAGGTVATYYWFSQTSFYQNNEAIVGLPWGVVMQWLMIIIGFLMVSSVPYPAWPKVGLRSLKGILGLAAILFILFGIGYWRRAFFFPFGIAYVTWGLARAFLLGIWERRPGRDRTVDAYGTPVAPRPARRSAPRGMPAVGSMDEAEALGLLDDDRDDLLEDDTDYFDEPDEPVRPVRRAERVERIERDRGERGDRGARKARRDRPERPERAERAERAERTERTERPERAARPDRPDRPERSPRADRPERPARDEGEGMASVNGGGERDGPARKRRKRRKGRGAGTAGADVGGPVTDDPPPSGTPGLGRAPMPEAGPPSASSPSPSPSFAPPPVAPPPSPAPEAPRPMGGPTREDSPE